eukprot:SAG25_NODE_262_length_10711_cov_10.264512_4_plen_141_part_00
MTAPGAMEEFFFDLRGFTVLKGALSSPEVEALAGWLCERADDIREVMRNDDVDYMPTQPSRDLGGCRVQSYHRGEHNRSRLPPDVDDGVNLQYPWLAGAPWDSLIDHPSWIGRVQHYLGMYSCLCSVRGCGKYVKCAART